MTPDTSPSSSACPRPSATGSTHEILHPDPREEAALSSRLEGVGNGGAGKGLVGVTAVCEGCVLFKANPQKPPPEDELPAALAEVLQKWMLSSPVRVRETLLIVPGGNLVALFVWYDRAGP